jgi:hypothetical protein
VLLAVFELADPGRQAMTASSRRTRIRPVTTGTGPNVFGPVALPVDISQNIYAGFGELNLPFTDRFFIELAARYEDYGKNGGSTFNPQGRLKWQITDLLALRGSVGTTFRAPPQGSLIPNPTTNLQQVLGTFIPVSTIGNPDLDPEKATVYSVGLIIQTGGFRGSVDYWNYNFKDVLTSEPLTPVVNAVFPNGASGANNCNNAALAGFIADHFVFSGPCGPGVVAVLLQAINGPRVKTAGVDVDLSYQFEEVWGGTLTATALFTYVDKYNVGALTIGTVVIPAFHASASSTPARSPTRSRSSRDVRAELRARAVQRALADPLHRLLHRPADRAVQLQPDLCDADQSDRHRHARGEDQRPGAARCDRAVAGAVRHAGQPVGHQHLRQGSAVRPDRPQLRCADGRPVGPDVQVRHHQDVLIRRCGARLRGGARREVGGPGAATGGAGSLFGAGNADRRPQTLIEALPGSTGDPRRTGSRSTRSWARCSRSSGRRATAA